MATSGFNAGLDSSDAVLSYAKESTYATDPATPFQKIRLTGEGFTETKSRTRPNEIDAKGQASAALTTQVEASGSLNFGVSYGTYDDLLQSLINSADWTSQVLVSNSSAVGVTFLQGSEGSIGCLHLSKIMICHWQNPELSTLEFDLFGHRQRIIGPALEQAQDGKIGQDIVVVRPELE